MKINYYRFKYYWRKTCNFFGYCPCGSRVNVTRHGQSICPSCRSR